MLACVKGDAMHRKSVYRYKYLIWGILLMSLVLPFQNCGKAGFENASEQGLESITSEGKSADQRISSAPFPFEANINQISYMTCPMAGQNKQVQESSSLSKPYYSVRVGGYDNSPYASDALASLSPEEINKRLVSGVRIKPNFFQYVKDTFKRTDDGINNFVLEQYLQARTYQLNIGLIKQERSQSNMVGESGFGYSDDMFSPTLQPLGYGESILSSLLKGDTLGSWNQKQRLSSFSNAEPASRSLVSTIHWGQSEQDSSVLAYQLSSQNLMVHLGFSEDSADSIRSFLDPSLSTSNNHKTLLGRSYLLKLGLIAPSGSNSGPKGLTGISEMDYSESSTGKNLTDLEGQGWDCFSMVVVRHIDQIDPSSGFPYCAGLGSSCTSKGPQTIEVTTGANPDGTPIKMPVLGVHYACPPALVSQMTPLEFERFQVARRMLPAEFFEVNTQSGYMCVVPTELSEQKDQCYFSGDSEAGKYIQYNFNGCGPNANECPSAVSFCYRKQ